MEIKQANKYDTMVEKNQKRNAAKAEHAIKYIQIMREKKEPVSVRSLAKQTGLSASFFYKNPEIRELIRNSIRQQPDTASEKKADALLNKALIRQVKMLKEEISRLEEENAALKEEIGKLEGRILFPDSWRS